MAWKTKSMDMAHSVTESQDAEELIKYILEGRENDLLKQGAQLITDLERCHEDILTGVEKDAAEILVDFREEFEPMVAEFCFIHKQDNYKPPAQAKRRATKDFRPKEAKENKKENNSPRGDVTSMSTKPEQAVTPPPEDDFLLASETLITPESSFKEELILDLMGENPSERDRDRDR